MTRKMMLNCLTSVGSSPDSTLSFDELGRALAIINFACQYSLLASAALPSFVENISLCPTSLSFSRIPAKTLPTLSCSLFHVYARFCFARLLFHPIFHHVSPIAFGHPLSRHCGGINFRSSVAIGAYKHEL
ncbi:hypothetical protein RvY_00531-2 [Ramazzottius varieornatus]|uniref:Uncharacterized protein n=1 Tax=Ramazzottius varieornatus TaxID=947166 RepID=A0A1D1UE12_RAMVA|nr:hypothetical protein RvY_00531-2 [Ramazzottius varieornatus]